MNSVMIRDAISGEPRTIDNPLLPEHIQVGRVFWYDGFTSTSGWNCPAVITQVNEKKKEFRVRSLDDMREQDQWYDFSPEKDTANSRKTMRLTTATEVNEYLEQQRFSLESAVAHHKSLHDDAVSGLKHFDEVRSSLRFLES